LHLGKTLQLKPSLKKQLLLQLKQFKSKSLLQLKAE
jgi:hypothetical protein